jgi:hypothetical protein
VTDITTIENILQETGKEVAAFLKESSIFQSLDTSVLQNLSELFETVLCGPGHIVFKKGDTADAIFIVEEGAVEVVSEGEPSQVVAYLTAGECFGEMGYLHESARSASVRVPEQATLLRLPNESLKDLTRKYPEVTAAIADIINKRMAGILPFKPAALQGNLAFFDLATVIQAALSSNKDGVIALFARGAKPVATLALKKGKLINATYNQLAGEIALYELMSRSDPYDFTFEQRDVSVIPENTALASRPPHMLMIEGARRQDELKRMMEQVGWPDAIYTQAGKLPVWTALPESEQQWAGKVWLLMEAGCTVEEIAEQMPVDRYTVLSIVSHALNEKYVDKDATAAEGLTMLRKISEATGESLKPAATIRLTGETRKPSLTGEMRKPGAGKATGSVRIGGEVSMSGPTVRNFVSLVHAINTIMQNLAMITTKNEVRFVLNQSLAKAAQQFPALSSLSVQADSASIDVRNVSPELSEGEMGMLALEHLMRTFIDISATMQKF